jgi:phytoene synthase
MADVVASTSQPPLGAIRLAWWRERLEALDSGGTAPAEPRLRRVADELLPRGISGKQVSDLEDGWLPLFEPFPWGEPVAKGLRRRGRVLFGLGARILGCDPGDAEAEGELWSLVDGARHCSDARSRTFLLEQGRRTLAALPRRKPPRFLRRLTGLAAMAAHDVLKNESDLPYFAPGRGMAATFHYFRGTLPRG